jgi:hypothetical protein
MREILIFLLIWKTFALSLKTGLESERSAPFLMYPIATSAGVAVAIAIPVPDNENNLFVSYNFEINYNVVNTAQESFPGPLVRLKLAGNETNGRQDRSLESISKRVVITRIGVYRVIESVLNA